MFAASKTLEWNGKPPIILSQPDGRGSEYKRGRRVSNSIHYRKIAASFRGPFAPEGRLCLLSFHCGTPELPTNVSSIRKNPYNLSQYLS